MANSSGDSNGDALRRGVGPLRVWLRRFKLDNNAGPPQICAARAGLSNVVNALKSPFP